MSTSPANILDPTGPCKDVFAAYADIKGVHMRTLFEDDAERATKMNLSIDLGETLPNGKANTIFLDYSKNIIDERALLSLLDSFKTAGVLSHRDAMFSGEKVNATEGRAVLHTALRNMDKDASICVDGQNVLPEVRAVRAKVRNFVERVRSGEWKGATGQRIQTVVNIGIGGSDLGPAMVTAALRCYTSEYRAAAGGKGGDGLRVRFVSNVDGAHLNAVLSDCNPETTMFVIASKTFTTQETMANASAAKEWLTTKLGPDATSKHFCAVSTNADAVGAFGIDTENMFGFWDWVGGRYSVWSAIGLPVAMAIGGDAYEEFLAGAFAVDTHFASAPLTRNGPLILAALQVWYRNFFGYTTHGLIPYSQDMARFAAYFQQADMESNGKGARADGMRIDDLNTPYATGPIVWGEPGTNGQHAFFQLLHQGTEVVPCDFIASATPYDWDAMAQTPSPIGSAQSSRQHTLLLSNFLAQPMALMRGLTESEVRASGVAEALVPHKVFPGNRPTNTLLVGALTPRALGGLIALYEHKIFAVGSFWGLNSFDQWGVELGKVLAKDVLPLLEGKSAPKGSKVDASTAALIDRIRALQEGV